MSALGCFGLQETNMAHLKSVLTFPPASAEERSAATLAGHYTAVRQQTDALTASLSAEDLDGAVLSGGQPGQVAPGTYQLVL